MRHRNPSILYRLETIDASHFIELALLRLFSLYICGTECTELRDTPCISHCSFNRG